MMLEQVIIYWSGIKMNKLEKLIDDNKDIGELCESWKNTFINGFTYNNSNPELQERLLYEFVEFNVDKYRRYDRFPKGHYLRWEVK